MDFLYLKYFFSIYYGNKFRELSSVKENRVDALKDRMAFLNANDANKYIYNGLIGSEPFMAGRIGGTELSAMKDYVLFKNIFFVPRIRKKIIDKMALWSGFFPANTKLCMKFCELMMESIKETDLQVMIWAGFENYFIEKYAPPKTVLTSLNSFEPWQNNIEVPWSAALEGKKVLVIHPFSESIKKQYQNRDRLFPGTDILPEFDLHVLKAVQTIAGEKDSRFNDWFEALEYMYQEAMKIDFDIAIIGCGAYGYPLAAKLKKSGKKAIHLAGATQLLFGIKGARWESEQYNYINKYFNEWWCYPSENETPKNAQKVEGSCYW